MDGSQNEKMEVDVLFVGAGPASLAGAIHLKRLIKTHNAKNPDRSLYPTVFIIEKGAEANSHAFSGAVLDPRSLRELLTADEFNQLPLLGPVGREEMAYLTPSRKFAFPMVPPAFKHHGCHIVSLHRLVGFLAHLAQGEGVEIMPGFPGQETILENQRVIGVRTTPSGLDKKGQPKGNFTPGTDIIAKLTLFGEGPRGTLSKRLIKDFKLDRGRVPMIYATGLKELWEVPPGRIKRGEVFHTMGFPLPADAFGGGFIYALDDSRLYLGLVVGLDYRDPHCDPHYLLQKYKLHPFVRSLLEGGKLVRYGAKTIPEGGFNAIPQTWVDGALLIGDNAGFLNAMRLKGIHLAIKSGMLAAETAFDALLRNDFSGNTLKQFDQKWRDSWMGEELRRSRNFRQGFKSGMFFGMANAALGLFNGGRGVFATINTLADHQESLKLNETKSLPLTPESRRGDGKLTFDKVTDVYHSGTQHEEDQPCHLQISDPAICETRCREEYGNPCQNFCPAAVYEMVAGSDGKTHLHLNAANCVHCKTCDIKDPYQIITWVAPEGGGGPNYEEM